MELIPFLDIETAWFVESTKEWHKHGYIMYLISCMSMILWGKFPAECITETNICQLSAASQSEARFKIFVTNPDYAWLECSQRYSSLAHSMPYTPWSLQRTNHIWQLNAIQINVFGAKPLDFHKMWYAKWDELKGPIYKFKAQTSMYYGYHNNSPNGNLLQSSDLTVTILRTSI